MPNIFDTTANKEHFFRSGVKETETRGAKAETRGWCQGDRSSLRFFILHYVISIYITTSNYLMKDWKRVNMTEAINSNRVKLQ